jgi:radical SAM protein with 4Fe4S-binding SPASM domain
MLAVVTRIPVPQRVLTYMKPFGDGYTVREPRDPLERERWSSRYHVLRPCKVNRASDAKQAQGKELLQSIREKFKRMEEERRAHIQCKKESVSDERLNKCSRCKIMFYCSKECQQTHWSIHTRNLVKIRIDLCCLSAWCPFRRTLDDCARWERVVAR